MFHLFLAAVMPVILVIIQPGKPPIVIPTTMKVPAKKAAPKKCKTKL